MTGFKGHDEQPSHREKPLVGHVSDQDRGPRSNNEGSLSDLCVDGMCARIRPPSGGPLPLDDRRFSTERKALDSFVFGSTLSVKQLQQLQGDHERAFTREGQEAWIRATRVEITAALEQLFAAIDREDPGIRFVHGPWTPPEERKTGDYRHSGDDLAGARFVIQYDINVAASGHPVDLRRISVIIPWADRTELLGPSDNFRVRFQVHRTDPIGDGFIGLAYKVTRDDKGRIIEFFPDLFALRQEEIRDLEKSGSQPKWRYPGIADTPDPAHCNLCHGSLLSRIDEKKFRGFPDFAKHAEQMPGHGDFMSALTQRYEKDPAKRTLYEQILKIELANPRNWVPMDIRQANQRNWIQYTREAMGLKR